MNNITKYDRFMNHMRSIFKSLPETERDSINLLLYNLKNNNVKSATWQMIKIIQCLYKNRMVRTFEL